jgi:hypothetical protein
MSGGANAHMHSVDHHSHEAHGAHDHDHDHDRAANVIADAASIEADSSRLDANNTETLTQAHYSHGHSHHHAAGLPASCDLLAAVDPPSLKPVSRLPIVSSVVDNNIERPKWPVTTPSVVSLLS